MTQEVLKLAKILENIEGYRATMTAAHELRRLHEENKKLKEALAQLEQKPVADDFFRMIADRNPKPFSSPQRTWVGLTDVEIDYLLGSTVGENEETHISFARAIESKLKEVNT